MSFSLNSLEFISRSRVLESHRYILTHALSYVLQVSVEVSPLVAIANTSTAAVSTGNIAAAAASAAGATKEEVIQTAAMTAGTAAAVDARIAGKSEVTVEAKAAQAAEIAAAEAGADKNEAAEAGGEAAVLVAGQARSQNKPSAY